MRTFPRKQADRDSPGSSESSWEAAGIGVDQGVLGSGDGIPGFPVVLTAERHQGGYGAWTGEDRTPLLVIGSRRWAGLELRDLWAHRDLFYILAWRDVKVRYKQTALGALWAILQPVLTMVVFTFLFGRLARVPSDGQPYAIFS